MTRRLIEDWLPIAALGIESVRERTPMTPFPAPNRLHVWWARRPLVASRAAVLASILPADVDRERFVQVLGIHGDPVAVAERIAEARRAGERFEGQAYDYPRAFLHSPTPDESTWIESEVSRVTSKPVLCLDPMAGGGGIPFESLRLGMHTFANDLNPVAALILNATVKFPAEYGISVVDRYSELAVALVDRRETRLTSLFPSEPAVDDIPTNYLWARTIRCPYCDGVIPLSPNWTLGPGKGIQLHPDIARRVCDFEVVGTREQSEGTVSRGTAACPFPDCKRTIDGDEVKAQAQAGGMGDQLYCVVYKRRIVKNTKAGRTRDAWERSYRAPRLEDDNSEAIAQRLAEKLPEWEALDMVPTERFPSDGNDTRPIQYGMPLWRDLFSPRQLLCHVISVVVYRELLAEEEAKGTLDGVTRAAFVYLSFALDKSRDYNSRLTHWHSTRAVVAGTFDRHDFAFKWSYVEMAPPIGKLGDDWAIDATGKAIKELVELVRPGDAASNMSRRKNTPASAHLMPPEQAAAPSPVTITCESADSMHRLADGSVDVVVVDPPYYDNVMYAELSDFFYVWLKRTAGYVYPDLFLRQLTDKDREAVANPARFSDSRGARARAHREYREKMAAIFSEIRRVLKPDGILTLMFTHKATGAWDALASGLMEAGFTVTASWPINTEATGSLHIRDRSAANSTIFLVCRPRLVRAEDDARYWEDVEPLVAKAVRQQVARYQEDGIAGVDLYLACFGPALKELAEHWPLRRGQPRPEQRTRRGQATLLEEDDDPYAVTPEDALQAARHEVKQWRLEQIMHTARQVDLDPLTEWFVLAWDAFKAPVFPYDEALRLARVVGIDLDADIVKRLAEKKGSDIVLWDSETRARKGAIGPADGSRGMIDTLHHLAYRARSRGLETAKELAEQDGLVDDAQFLQALTAVLEVLPADKFKGRKGASAAVDEAGSDFEALENLRRLVFSEQVAEPHQLGMGI